MRMRFSMLLAAVFNCAFARPPSCGGRKVHYPLTNRIPMQLSIANRISLPNVKIEKPHSKPTVHV